MSELAHDLIALDSGDVSVTLSKALRAQFIAASGKKLIGADFSQVELRVNAWLAGETWLLDEFRKIDAGVGVSPYISAYARSFGVPAESIRKGSEEYDIGKKASLSCTYQGSVGAWLRFDPNPERVVKTVTDQYYGSEEWEKARKQAEHTVYKNGLSDNQWIAIKIVSNLWRGAHPAIVQSWWDYGDAAIEAVDSPGVIVPVASGRVRYLCAEGFLWCRLPSGKLLAYCRPRLVETREDYLVDEEGDMISVDELTDDEIKQRVADGAEYKEGRKRVQVQFDGVNQKTRVWGPLRLYGGLQTNNNVQGTARELLRCAMNNVESANYPIVLHVHDELVSEVAEDFGGVEEYESLISLLPAWATGLPLAAKARTGQRYI